MNPQSIDVYVILDRSGSMAPLAHTVVEETNSLFDNLRADPEIATVTLVMFESADPFDCVLDHLPIHRLGKLGANDYQPGTGTPLWDAIGSTIDLATRHQAAAQRSILVAVMTDGEENDSVHYNARRLYGKLRRRQAAGWQFLYLGAGRDPFADAAEIGLPAAAVVPWEADHAGTRAAFATLTAFTTHRGRR